MANDKKPIMFGNFEIRESKDWQSRFPVGPVHWDFFDRGDGALLLADQPNLDASHEARQQQALKRLEEIRHAKR